MQWPALLIGNVPRRSTGCLLIRAGPVFRERTNKDIFELLITKGAKVDVKNAWGHTALSLAEEQGHTSIVEFLRKHGAKE